MKEFHDLSAAEAVKFYEKIGMKSEAENIRQNNHVADLEAIDWPWSSPKPYEHTSYAYGFISEATAGKNSLSISDARNIMGDNTLKNSGLTVSLDFLRIFDYPGHGTHKILFKFNAKNQFTDKDEDIHFNQTFSIEDGERAAISGYPIFIGLKAGSELVQFNVEIVNVSNDNDDTVLNIINSGVFSNGLKLIGTLNPVVPIVTEYAKGITQMIAQRNNNRDIPAPKMGLYFDNMPTRMKLAKGAYIAIQMSNPDLFNWNDWVFDRAHGTIQMADGSQTELPFNYFVFSISKTN